MSPPWVVTTIGTPGAASVATRACGMAQWAWMTSGFAERTTRRIANYCASTSAGTCTMRERRSLRLSRIAPSARSSNAAGSRGTAGRATSSMRSAARRRRHPRGQHERVELERLLVGEVEHEGRHTVVRPGRERGARTSKRGRSRVDGRAVGRDIVPFRGWRGTVRTALTPVRVLIHNSDSPHNRGDRAILAGNVELVRRRWPDAEIVSLSQYPERDAAWFGIRFLPVSPYSTGIGDLFALLRAARSADVVLWGGGEILKDYTNKLGLVYWLARCCSSVRSTRTSSARSRASVRPRPGSASA